VQCREGQGRSATGGEQCKSALLQAQQQAGAHTGLASTLVHTHCIWRLLILTRYRREVYFGLKRNTSRGVISDTAGSLSSTLQATEGGAGAGSRMMRMDAAVGQR
jgi:hypothetical protein